MKTMLGLLPGGRRLAMHAIARHHALRALNPSCIALRGTRTATDAKSYDSKWGAPLSRSPLASSGGEAAAARASLQRCFASAPGDSPGEGASSEKSSSSSSASWLTLPTMLTLARIAAVPLVAAAFYLPLPWAPRACTALFIAASVTDWLDGYLARKMNLKSAFGAFLDPVADKLMVTAVLVLLCSEAIPSGPLAGNTMLIPVSSVVIIGREIAISALREWAASKGPDASKGVAVNNIGKWKTAFQMISLGLFLFLREGTGGALSDLAGWAGPALLAVSAVLTVVSMVVYFKGALKTLL